MNMTTVPSNQLKAMQHEIADLKEQLAQLRIEADFNFEQYQDAGRLLCDLQEITEQQAEAIRVKDAALIAVRDDLELRMQIAEEESLNISNSVLDQMCDAIDLQPSPDILQARDERVAAACANLVNRFISGDGILNDTWVHEIEDEILSGEWRKYL